MRVQESNLMDVREAFILLLCGLVVSATASVTDPCYFSPDALYVNGKCLTAYVDNQSLPWYDAQKFCQAKDGHGTLAELRTGFEISIVQSGVYHSQVNWYNKIMWIGAYFDQEEETYKWASNHTNVSNAHDSIYISSLTQTIEDFTDGFCVALRSRYKEKRLLPRNCSTSYSFLCQQVFATSDTILLGATKVNDTWRGLSSGKPFDYFDWIWRSEVYTNGTFLVMKKNRAFWWNTTDFEIHPSLCQRDIGNPCDGQFPGAIYSHGQCLKFFSTSMTWMDAQATCQEHNAFLVEPKTEEENLALTRYLYSQEGTGNVSWLGATRDQNGEFQWVTSQTKLMSANGSIIEKADKGMYLAITSGIWEAKEKDKKLVFVCQKENEPDTDQTFVIIHPSVEESTTLAVIHVTSGMSYPVYLKFLYWTDAWTDVVRTCVTYIEAVRHEIDPQMKVNSTSIDKKYLLLEATDFVTVVLLLKNENSLGSTLLTHSLFTKDAMARDIYFLPTASDDEENSGKFLFVKSQRNAPTRLVLYQRHAKVEVPYNGLEYTSRGVSKISAIFNEKYESLQIFNYSSLDGDFLESSGGVAVFLGNLKSEQAGNVSNSNTNIDYVLPIDIADKEYITFPPVHTLRITALHEDTVVMIFDGQISIWIRTITLAFPGDTKDVFVPKDLFHYVRSEKPFYILQFGTSSQRPNNCMTTLFPKSLWRYQYDFAMTSDFDDYETTILVIVKTEMTSLIRMNSQDFTMTSQPIGGTSYSGCTLKSNITNTGHIYLANHTARFGAYITVFTDYSTTCHPLGYQNPPLLKHDFNVNAHLSNYWFNNCTESDTTTTAPPYDTTEASMETTGVDFNDTISHSGEVSPTTEIIPSRISTEQSFNDSVQQAKDLARKISKRLHVDAKTTSAFRRSKISVLDKRTSSVVIGLSGIVFISIVFSLMLCFDICNFFARAAFKEK